MTHIKEDTVKQVQIIRDKNGKIVALQDVTNGEIQDDEPYVAETHEDDHG